MNYGTKKATKMMTATCAALMTVVGPVMANGLSVHAASLDKSNDAYSAYEKILENIPNSDTYGASAFSIVDLNNDGTPELICDEDNNPRTMVDFYTFNDGQAIKLDTSNMIIDSTGYFAVSKERGTFSWHKNSPNAFENDNTYITEFEIDGNTVNVKNQYNAIEKANDSWEYNHNSDSINKEDFDSFVASNEEILVYQNNANNRAVQCKSMDETDTSASTDPDIISVEDIDLSKFEEVILADDADTNVEETKEETVAENVETETTEDTQATDSEATDELVESFEM